MSFAASLRSIISLIIIIVKCEGAWEKGLIGSHDLRFYTFLVL